MAEITSNTWKHSSCFAITHTHTQSVDHRKPFPVCCDHRESEWVRQTGHDMAERGRKSPFDTDNLKHLLESDSKTACSKTWDLRLSASCRSELCFCWLPNKCQARSVWRQMITCCTGVFVPVTDVTWWQRQSLFSKCFPVAPPAEKPNVPKHNRNTDIPACYRTMKSNKELTWGPLGNTHGARENMFLQYNACRHPTNMLWAVPIVSEAPKVYYVNIPSIRHHDYIQSLSRKWFHIQHPP